MEHGAQSISRVVSKKSCPYIVDLILAAGSLLTHVASLGNKLRFRRVLFDESLDPEARQIISPWAYGLLLPLVEYLVNECDALGRRELPLGIL